MARRLGWWTLTEFVLFNLATLLLVVGVVVAARVNTVTGLAMAVVGAGTSMALGFRMRGQIKRDGDARSSGV